MFAFASADPFDDPLIKQVHERHDKGIHGDKQAVIDLVADLEKWTKEQPQNYLLLAYLGSAYTLRSRDVWPGPSKGRFLADGLHTMDRAVAGNPDLVAPRFIRAVNNFNLPAFIFRRDTGREDFKILIKKIFDPNTQEKLNAETRQGICYYAGLAYKQLDQRKDAIDAWEKGLSIISNNDMASKIREELKKIRED